jgi:hypothetical protein
VDRVMCTYILGTVASWSVGTKLMTAENHTIA